MAKRIVLGLLAALAVLGVAAAIVVYVLSERRIRRHFDVAAEPHLSLPSDSASLARGRHLVTATGCVLCHGEDLGGTVYTDVPRVARIPAPNLTSGQGGRARTSTDVDWERALRHGIHRDGTSLVLMPAEVYTYLSDADAAAMLAFIRRATPMNRESDPVTFGPIGRLLLARGGFSVLVAEKTPRVPHVASVTPGPTAQYGRYLADVAGCRGCHGLHLSGGYVIGPPGVPLASNLTPTGLASWSESDFVKALRTGRRPNGTPINPFMPWRTIGQMTDEELHALWLYLQSVPPMEFGHR